MTATAPAWRWIPESEELALDTPRRQLTIRWDEEDRGWFLSVVRPPSPATMGQPATEAERYVCPLPLLCALVLVPPSLHEHLKRRVYRELVQARGQVHNLLGEAVGQLPEPWPSPSHAMHRLDAAAAVGHEVERLSLDWAAAGAMEE